LLVQLLDCGCTDRRTVWQLNCLFNC